MTEIRLQRPGVGALVPSDCQTSALPHKHKRMPLYSLKTSRSVEARLPAHRGRGASMFQFMRGTALGIKLWSNTSHQFVCNN